MNVYLELFYGLSITLMLVVGSYILGNVIWILITSKSEDEKLKKARERSINKINDRKVKEYIKHIKTAYKNGDRYEEISRFDSFWSKYDANYIHNAVYKWLDDNGIKYHTVTNVYDITIYFDE